MAKVTCKTCGGTGSTYRGTSHGPVKKGKCSDCGGRKVRDQLFNVYNSGNGDSPMLNAKKLKLTTESKAHAWLEELVSRGYSRESLFVKEC